MPRSSVQGKKRRAELTGILSSQRNVSTAQLAGRFGVSEMTIRRDLKELQNSGVALPCYGGAMAAKRISFEFAFDKRHQANIAQKRRIGLAGAGKISDGQIVFLDTGTTTLEIARALSRMNIRCTVITGSLVITSELWGKENIQLQLLGGQVRQKNPDLIGPYSEIMLDRFAADVAFLGSDGIDPVRGSFAGDLDTARIAEKMAFNASKVIVVADSSKLPRTGLARYLQIKNMDELITDKKANPAAVRKLRSQMVKITLV